MKKLLLRIFIVILCIIIIGFAVGFLSNHLRLMNLEHQLSDFPLPDETLAIEQQSAFGNLTGQSDSTDYITVLLVKSSLSKESLQKHYESSSFKTVLSSDLIKKLKKTYGEAVGKQEDDNEVYPVDVYVNNVEAFELKDIKDFSCAQNTSIDMLLNKTFSFKKLKDVGDYSDYYYIILYDNGYPELLDISILRSILSH